jgi:Uma2 family endonuclease
MLKKFDPLNGIQTVADLVAHLGDIPMERIRLHPLPGTATEKDVIAAEHQPRAALCELIDGVLVEKTMGMREALLAAVIGRLLDEFVEQHDLGIVLGADAMLRLWPKRVRIPDVSFISWDQIPGNEVPDDPIPDLPPTLAIEVLSRSNTKKEMEIKRHDYFRSGVREVWEIQPKTQSAEVYTSPTKHRHIGKDQALESGDILPGFKLPLDQLFARLKRRKNPRRRS